MSSPAADNPFPGLRPFNADEAHLFFGRDDEIDAMVDRLARQRLLAVLGGSGSGKSSLVNCGLRPALHAGLLARAGTAWRVAVCRPGGDPIGALAGALARRGVLFDAEPAAGLPLEQLIETTLRMSRLGLVDVVAQARLRAGSNLLLVVDQFEELFRFQRLGGAAADDASAFVGLLLQARAQRELPLYLVLTMRSDFLGECSAYEGLAQAINDAQHLVPRMSRDERRSAIAGPLAVAGARIEPVLLTRLVNDVGEDPDQLSILQHALNRTWAHWKSLGSDEAIGLRHYEHASVGTMAHALDRHAETAWLALPDDGARAVCERLMRALTDGASDPRGVRRPARLATLCEVTALGPEALCQVIEVLREPGRSFLMPPVPEALNADSVIDIAHESLMRVWRRLKGWTEDEARSAQQLRRLADAAALHAQGRGGLWRDPELHFTLEWAERAQPNPAWAAQYGVDLEPALAFLRASEAAREAERAASRRRQARRRVSLAALVAGLALIGVVFGVLWQRGERLLAAAEAANMRKLVLQSRAMLDGQVSTTIDVALQLSVAAFRLGANNESYAGMQAALDHTARLQRVLALPGPVLGFSPDQRFAVVVDGAALQLHDAVGGARLAPPLKGHEAVVNAVAFSADGHLLASASDDGTVRLWDSARGTAIGAPLRGHLDRVWSVAIGPGGRWLASGDEQGSVLLRELGQDGAVHTLAGHRRRVWGLAFSPDGRTLATASDDGSVLLWDVATGKPRGGPLLGHDGVVSALAFSPDGRRLVSAGGDRSLRLWDTRTGRPVGAPLRGHTSRVWSVGFSPDGGRLVSAGEDQTVRLWHADSGQALGAALVGHKNRVWRVAFAADGASVLSASNDRTLMRWRADDNPADLLRGHAGAVRAVAASPDGRLLASGGDDGSVRLWDLDRRAARGEPLRGHGAGVSAVAFSPDGGSIVSASEDGTLRRWSVATGLPLGAPLDGGGGPVWTIAISPDGRTLASGGGDAAVRLWDLASGQLLAPPLTGHLARIWSLAFSPDGSRLASGGDDATLRLWDVERGAALGAPLAGHAQRVWSVAFSPDGQRIASGSEDGSLRLWRVDDGQPLGPPLTGHLQAVTAVAFGPDGGTLASASDDATLRYWDGRSGEPRGAALRGHEGAAVALTFAADGRTLVSASVDGTLRLWDSPQVWVERMCTKLAGNLSLDDWRRHVGAVEYRPQCPQAGRGHAALPWPQVPVAGKPGALDSQAGGLLGWRT